MYQALYRKYRPTNFNDVVGQEVIIKTLKNAIINDRISHAYLFCGPRGTGKTTIAKIIAKTVNCLNMKDGIPCDECKNCIQFNEKQTTDIIEIDAASNNGVDEIREIRNKVSLVPNSGKYKIYIIDEVHMLTVGAFNALLKTLEEPPKHIIFILATTEPHKIPMTILSRCQRFDFKKIPDRKIVERLKIISQNEDIKIDEDALNEIAHLSDGGMRDSISLLDQAVAYSENEITINDIHEINGTITNDEMKEFITKIGEKDLVNVLDFIDQYNEKGKNLIKLVEEIMIYLKNILLYKKVPDYVEENNKYLYETIKELFSEKDIIYYIESINGTLNQMKLSNQPKILLEVCLVKIISSSGTTEIVKEINDNEELPSNTNIIKQKNAQRKDYDFKKDQTNVRDKDYDSKIEQLSKIRINNALAGFKKIYLQEVKGKIDTVREYLFDEEYNEFVSLILDGAIKASSDSHIIFVFNHEWQSNKFNENIVKIEELLEKIYKKKYIVISTDLNHWNTIKDEFNSKKNKYSLINEPIELTNFFVKKDKKNEIEETFSDIIEYE